MVSELHLTISGHVQGVFFRVFVRDLAEKMGLVGVVRNLPDGTLEVVAQGPREKLETLKQSCYDGPEHARVEQVSAKWREAQREYQTFKIL